MAKIVYLRAWSRTHFKTLKMSMNTTDRIFREKLRDYASPPPMHVWESIAEKRSRRRPWILLRRNLGLLALVVLIFGSAAWYLGQTQKDAHLAAFDIHIPQNSPQKLLTKGIASSNIAATGEGEGFNAKAGIPTDIVGLPVAQNLIENSVSKPVLSSEKDKNKAKKTADSEGSIKPPFTETPKAPGQISNSDLGLLAIEGLPLKDFELELPKPVFPKFDPEKGCPEIEKRSRFSLYFDLAFSPDVAFRSLTVKSPDNVGYLRARERTESGRYAWSGALRLSIVGRRGFALRTGLTYAQINEKFEFTDANVEKIEIKTIYDPITGEIIGTDTVITKGTRQIITYNRFHFIDIPLILGYEVETRKWVYSLNAGANFNFLFRKKGEFLAPDSQPVTFTSGATGAFPAFRNTVGMSLFGSMGLNYKITDNMQWIIEPHIRYYLNPVSRTDYLLNQKYLSVGLFTGLRIKL